MISLSIDPQTPLRTLILAKGVTQDIYVNNETPSSALPAHFLEIAQNGPIKTGSTHRGNGECMLALSIYVQNLSTGVTNNVKMKMILDQFATIFDAPLKSGVFSYSLEPSNLIYSGKSLAAGYSTKIINIQTHINY